MAFSLRNPPSFAARHRAYPYQLEAVRAIQGLPAAAVFHEPGLGKTKIGTDLILLWLSTDAIDTSLVVTKKALVDNWTREVKAHCHITPWILSTNRRDNAIALNRPVLIYVTNYEVISTNVDLIREFLGTCRVAVVLDESQRIKNPDSRVARAFHSLAPRFSRRVIMTGTPVANRPHDLWSQVKFLDDGVALGTSFEQFRKELDLPAGQSDGVYADRLAAVWSKIGHFAVRETKASAGIELPQKTIVDHPVALTGRQAAIYTEYRDRMAHEYGDHETVRHDDADDILKRLLRLVQCASNPSLIDSTYSEIPAKYPIVEKLCAALVPDHKVIVWTTFVKNARWLARSLDRFGALALHGKMAINDRNRAISRFIAEKRLRILVATPGTAKEGLTLTVANHAIFYDRSFSLDDYLQAQDRIHRISQKQDCVVHNIIARDTIDEWIDTLLRAKYFAAQLAHGDIQKDDFRELFQFDLAASLRALLNVQSRTDN